MSAELLEIVNANPYFEILETGKVRNDKIKQGEI